MNALRTTAETAPRTERAEQDRRNDHKTLREAYHREIEKVLRGFQEVGREASPQLAFDALEHIAWANRRKQRFGKVWVRTA